MVQETFERDLMDWETHCESPAVVDSSIGELEKACAAYWNIVSMGEEALPLLREVYDRDDYERPGLSCIKAHGLVAAVKDILGDRFFIPEDIQGNLPAMQTYTAYFIDEYLNETAY